MSKLIKIYLTVILALLFAVFLSGFANAEEPKPEPQASAPETSAPQAPAPETSAPQAPAPETSVPQAPPDERISHYPPTVPAPQSSTPQASPSQNAQPAPRLLTLEEAINMALPGHPKIKAATQDLRAGQFNTLGVQAAFWPQITFDANRNYIWSQRLVRIGSTTITTSADYVANNFTFNGNWTVFDFGRTYFNVKSSRSLEDSLRDNLNGAEQTVAYDIMDAYYNVLKAQSLVKVAHETLDDANKHLSQAQAFYEVGTKPKFDVTQADVQVNNAKVQVIQAEDAVRAAVVNLNTRIGIDPLAPTEVVDRPELEPLDQPLDYYLKQAIENRQDLKNLEDVLRSNEMLVKSKFADFLPTISTSASYNWYKEDHSDFLTNSGVILAADIPIFEGFRTVANVGQARATVLSNKYRIEDTKNDILNQVGVSYIAIEDARASVEALKVSVASARENLDIANGRYEAGVGAILDVTDAQVSLTSAEANLAQAFYNYHLAYSKLLRTTGTPPRNQK